MIYLFEDRMDRMYLYLEKNLKDFKDIINTSCVIDSNLENLELYVRKLENLEVFILHKSYNFIDKKITPTYVRDLVKKMGKKFVLFSGGLDNAIINEDEITMNSGHLYKRLPDYLEHYKKNDRADLHILFFENEKEYELHQLKKFQNEVFYILTSLKNNKDNSDIDLKKSLKKIKNIIEGFLLSDVFEDDKRKLLELIDRENPISIEILFEQTSKMISKYEEH